MKEKSSNEVMVWCDTVAFPKEWLQDYESFQSIAHGFDNKSGRERFCKTRNIDIDDRHNEVKVNQLFAKLEEFRLPQYRITYVPGMQINFLFFVCFAMYALC